MGLARNRFVRSREQTVRYSLNIRIFLIAALACLGACNQQSKSDGLKPNDWLLKANSDDERFRQIQRQLRGFDQPMWEVGERYARMHEALSRGNTELALYHWEKIKTTIENGVAKRPARQANAEALFLTPVWADVEGDLKSGDPARAWRGFARAKTACQACHTAEKVEYMNNQEVFDLVPPARVAE